MTLPDTQLNSIELLSSMTPEQKLGQLFLINLNGIEADQDYQIGRDVSLWQCVSVRSKSAQP